MINSSSCNLTPNGLSRVYREQGTFSSLIMAPAEATGPGLMSMVPDRNATIPNPVIPRTIPQGDAVRIHNHVRLVRDVR